jgi:DNA replication ATP-dependent helicase Dna2
MLVFTHIAEALYRELERIAVHPDWSAPQKVSALAAMLERLALEATKQEQLMFSTLFARLSFIGQKHQLDAGLMRRVHRFRHLAKQARIGYLPSENDAQRGLDALALFVLALSGSALPDSLIALLSPPESETEESRRETLTYAASLRITAVADDEAAQCLIAYEEDSPEQPLRIAYGLPERNENFNPSIKIIRQVFSFPLTLQLLDVDVSPDGRCRPRAFIIEPDYLVDVSAIAECFKENSVEPYAYVARKFLPYELTEPILLGNIANYFLDRLIHEPDLAWQDLFRETFRLYPFVYAPMSDMQVRGISQKSQKHFLTLQQMAKGGWEKAGIDPARSVVEPAFFSAQYGIQGRLDLLHRDDEKAIIVELKSGSPFKPNSYGIQRSHFTQTLLYDLLVRSVFGMSLDPTKYILYSGADINPLRFAPTVAPEQYEALQARNQIIALEYLLTRIRPGDETAPVLSRLQAAKTTGFLQRDFGRFESVYAALNLQERKYLNAFTGFIAREHWLAKLGEEGSEAGGHAALWRSDYESKEQIFSILSHLEIEENAADQPDAVIVFKKTARTNPLANFRVGDIAVLYPAYEDSDTVLRAQVIKCSIVALTPEHVKVQLRYRQFNLKPFETEAYWNLEPDLLDTGFAAQYRSLFEWAGAQSSKRDLLLGARAPGQPVATPQALPNDIAAPLTEEQREVFAQIIHSRDYYLLWGPPGTGKTSVMLHALAKWTLEHTEDNLLLLAYTNRAVDEICEALEQIGGDVKAQYLRIGSKFSTAERFRPQLLQQKISEAGRRSDLLAVLEKHRIFVSTVASFGQNDGLLRLKKFQRLVIDEASQILEPQLLGLLTRFEHFLLIGDHRQLPAVTVQANQHSSVADEHLHQIGLLDLRDSYFERLYRLCQLKGWTQAYGRLSRQGRMHADIMAFPNAHFYEGQLRTLAEEEGSDAHYQHETLWYDLPGYDAELENEIAHRRVVFLPTENETALPGQKNSAAEARQVVRLVQFFQKLFELNNIPWKPATTLGIITPWRAQIAQIREALAAANIDPDSLSIDTVERYQGGARDVIIVSTCVHFEYQLGALVSASTEGTDRKLNVALTRARRHVVLIGKADILKKDPRYAAFLDQYGK